MHSPLHVIPSPPYPVLQAHVKDPSVLVQEACTWQGDSVIHSSTSAGRRLHHTYVADGTGAKVCPSKQHHKLNGLETLDWCSHQTCNGILTEGYHHLPLHVSPSPVYPVLQAHVKDPSVLVQEALAWQGDWVTHSSMSASRRVIVQLRKTTQSNYHKKSKINYQELVEILS